MSFALPLQFEREIKIRVGKGEGGYSYTPVENTQTSYLSANTNQAKAIKN